jgi:hypothetical protein
VSFTSSRLPDVVNQRKTQLVISPRNNADSDYHSLGDVLTSSRHRNQSTVLGGKSNNSSSVMHSTVLSLSKHPPNLIKAKRTLTLVQNDFTRMFPDIHPLNNSLLAAYPEAEQPRNFQWFKSKRKTHRDAELYHVQAGPPTHQAMFPNKQASWLLANKLKDSKSLLNQFKETKVPKQKGVASSPIQIQDNRFENLEQQLIREHETNFKHQSTAILETVAALTRAAAELEPSVASTVMRDEQTSTRKLAHHLSNQELILINHVSKLKLKTADSSLLDLNSQSGVLMTEEPQVLETRNTQCADDSRQQ